MTTAELISAAGSYHSSAGNPSITLDLEARKRAHFLLTKVGNRVDNSAPHWWRNGDGSVVLSSGIGTMPADFAHAGDQMRVFISGVLQQEVLYKPPHFVKAAIATVPQTGAPTMWTLDGRTSVGLPKILTYPTSSATLLLRNYVKRMPELIDAPLSLVTAEGAAGSPSGAYNYKVTFVTASGETEGGVVSSTRTVSSKRLELTAIRTWHGRTVTARKIYRTAASGLQHKLVTTLSDNLTTIYSDNTADGALGANVPLPAEAVTGLEYFPEAFHDSALYDGLVYLLARGAGDGRSIELDAKWERSVLNLWEEYRQGKNRVVAPPPFPGFSRGRGVWDRFSRPE